MEQPAADVEVRGAATKRSPAGWSIRLDLVNRAGQLLGTREIASEADDCSAMADALPVVVALLVDVPRKDVRLALPEPTFVPRAYRSRPMVRPVEQPSRAWSVGLTASADVAYHLLPGTALGAAVSLWADPPWGWPLETWIESWYPTSSEGERAVRVVANNVGVGTCPWVFRSKLRIGACGGVAAGTISGSGQGLDYASEQIRPWADARLGARVDVPLWKLLSLRVDALAVVPITRHRYTYVLPDHSEVELFRPAPVVPLARVGLSLQLP